uniref:Uncharacterized protein n=1 Tax=Rhizophagus irregularis (strain DAOM 181602 / DAOM 197198 / MUCL 43194) TaxID=747089 RepID=U9TLV8_RHIID
MFQFEIRILNNECLLHHKIDKYEDVQSIIRLGYINLMKQILFNNIESDAYV